MFNDFFLLGDKMPRKNKKTKQKNSTIKRIPKASQKNVEIQQQQIKVEIQKEQQQPIMSLAEKETNNLQQYLKIEISKNMAYWALLKNYHNNLMNAENFTPKPFNRTFKDSVLDFYLNNKGTNIIVDDPRFVTDVLKRQSTDLNNFCYIDANGYIQINQSAIDNIIKNNPQNFTAQLTMQNQQLISKEKEFTLRDYQNIQEDIPKDKMKEKILGRYNAMQGNVGEILTLIFDKALYEFSGAKENKIHGMQTGKVTVQGKSIKIDTISSAEIAPRLLKKMLIEIKPPKDNQVKNYSSAKKYQDLSKIHLQKSRASDFLMKTAQKTLIISEKLKDNFYNAVVGYEQDPKNNMYKELKELMYPIFFTTISLGALMGHLNNNNSIQNKDFNNLIGENTDLNALTFFGWGFDELIVLNSPAFLLQILEETIQQQKNPKTSVKGLSLYYFWFLQRAWEKVNPAYLSKAAFYDRKIDAQLDMLTAYEAIKGNKDEIILRFNNEKLFV